MVISEKRYNLTEFEAHEAQHPDELLELIAGRIVEKVTSEEHGLIVLLIGNALLNWRKQENIRGYPSTESSYRVTDDSHNERRPDISFRYTDDSVSTESAVYTSPILLLK